MCSQNVIDKKWTAKSMKKICFETKWQMRYIKECVKCVKIIRNSVQINQRNNIQYVEIGEVLRSRWQVLNISLIVRHSISFRSIKTVPHVLIAHIHSYFKRLASIFFSLAKLYNLCVISFNHGILIAHSVDGFSAALLNTCQTLRSESLFVQ